MPYVGIALAVAVIGSFVIGRLLGKDDDDDYGGHPYRMAEDDWMGIGA